MSKLTKTQITSWLKQKFHTTLKTIYPEGYTCIICGKELTDEDRETSLCQKCRNSLPYRQENVCPVCGVYVENKGLCRNCAKTKPPFSTALAPFDYKGIIRSLINNYKDGGNAWMDRYIAKYLIDYILALDLKADLITFVPSSEHALLKRGFEHTRRVATHISKGTHIMLTDPLKCIANHNEQTSLKTAKRYINADTSFIVKEEFDRSEILGKKIILFDDIMTSGATVTKCAALLKEGGAKEVIIVTFSRA